MVPYTWEKNVLSAWKKNLPLTYLIIVGWRVTYCCSVGDDSVTFKVIGKRLNSWISVPSSPLTLLPSNEPKASKSTTTCHKNSKQIDNVQFERRLFHTLLRSVQHWWSNLNMSKLRRWLGEVHLVQWTVVSGRERTSPWRGWRQQDMWIQWRMFPITRRSLFSG